VKENEKLIDVDGDRLIVEDFRTDMVQDNEVSNYEVFESHLALDYYREKLKKDNVGLIKRNLRDITNYFGFLENLDEAFFKKNILVIFRHDEGSGSNRLTFEDFAEKKDGMEILLKRETGGFGTSDMAFWHMAITIPRNLHKENIKYFVKVKG
jgi:hypothetical protein